ncbi:MAG: hypothetical protein KDE26_21375 [Bacteroidetes bacterium]|nr:hypothetical protein [Bacteroidota bacterium]
MNDHIEKLWEIVDNNEVLDHYDTLKETFSSPLNIPEDEMYELGDLLTEFISSYIDYKRFDDLLEFIPIIKKHNYPAYKEIGYLINEFLVDYYTYLREEEKLKAPIEAFIENAVDYIDSLRKCFFKILFYGYSELTLHVIEKIYDEVENHPDLIGGVSYDLALVTFRNAQEKAYEHYLANQKIDWESFKEEVEKVSFEMEDTYVSMIESVFGMDHSAFRDTFLKKVKTESDLEIEKLGIRFMVYMKGQGMSFSVSGQIWDDLSEYWLDSDMKKSSNIFDLDKKSFRQFAVSNGGLILDYRFLSTAIVWGSCYAYDFLKEAGLISEPMYEETQVIIKELKKALIEENPSYLWEYDFVHEWPKPEQVTEEEFEKEKEIFGEGFDKQITNDESEREGFFLNKEDQKDIDGLFDSDLFGFDDEFGFDDDFDFDDEDSDEYTPAFKTSGAQPYKRETPKIGQNERISVKYLDGTVKENIKYKFVKDDITNGKCEIM